MAGQPGEGDVHVNALLTNMSIAYQNEMYIAEQIFPEVPVKKQSDIVPKYDQSYWFRRLARKLGNTEAPPRGGYEVNTEDTYFCHIHGIGHEVPDTDRANADNPFDLDRDGMAWCMDQILAGKEYTFVSDFWKTGVWGTDKTGGSNFTKFSTYATSTPIETLREYKRTIRRLIARNPNTMVLGDLVWDRLEDHPDMLDRIKYSASADRPAIVSTNLIAQLLSFQRVLVGEAIYTDDEEGTAEASVTYSAYWDDDALMLYRPDRPGLRVPSAGYTFVWTSVFGTPRYVRTRREPMADRATLIELFEAYAMKVTAARAGLFLSDAVD